MYGLRRIGLLIATFALLFACSSEQGSSEQGSSAQESEAADRDIDAAAKQAASASTQGSNNPLASQQQAIRDAQKIQGILTDDANEKKAAVKAAK